MLPMSEIRLTQYSHGAGCGCKIAPGVLSGILAASGPTEAMPGLLVGHETRDDAAVFDWGDGTAVVSTTDFFMPIVDDPHDFGRIAATNAMSDVWAMGGTPLVAIAVLGWPVKTVPVEAASRVIAGARAACLEAGIALAGGHSIDNPEPLFGLAVTGRVDLRHLKRNSDGVAGARLYLTKPLGVGILSTAQKRGILRPEHQALARDLMVQLNRVGEVFARADFVTAMTDVTGFGLLGHLGELCDGSGLSAEVEAGRVPLIDREVLLGYIREGAVPGGTGRNFESYGDGVAPMDETWRTLLCDPQTSGGLLVAVARGHEADFEALAAGEGLALEPFGTLTERAGHRITVR